MKINQALNLLALATVLSAGAALAQTTPTGTATSSSTPTGAVAPDSTPASGRTTNRNRANRRRGNQTSTNQNAGRSQDDKYRGSSAANGTSINNSNSTNYNSNNATTAPTGVGSNPASSGTTSTTSNNPDLSQSGSTSGSTMSGGSSMSAGSAPKSGAATGTGIAVKTARTTEEPAVAAGSTDRNTSIHDFVASSPNFTTLQNALQSAGLSETLKGIDPFTVFAPSNSAFKKLPTAAQNTLLEGRNRSALANLLSYHVVKGTVDTAELKRQIKAGNGKARLETLTGGTLTAQMGANDQITLTDEQGGTAQVDAADTHQTNGVVHSINAVLLPKGGTAAFR